jgi:hypothetical protein
MRHGDGEKLPGACAGMLPDVASRFDVQNSAILRAPSRPLIRKTKPIRIAPAAKRDKFVEFCEAIFEF